MCWAVTSTWGSTLKDEDSLNLDGMFYYSQKPNSHSLGFQSLSRKAVPVKCMLRKAQTLAGTEPCLELCWIIGTLLEHCCNLAGKSLKSCRNLAGALLAGRNFAGSWCWNMVKPCWNLAGTSGWNLWLEHFAGNQCGCRFRFSFYILVFLNVPGCEVGSLA